MFDSICSGEYYAKNLEVNVKYQNKYECIQNEGETNDMKIVTAQRMFLFSRKIFFIFSATQRIRWKV